MIASRARRVWLAPRTSVLAVAAARAALAASGLALVACSRSSPTPAPAALDDYLASVTALAPTARLAEVARWKLDPVAWQRTVVVPYRAAYADYAAAFDAEVPALVARLAAPGAITVRRHYAGDPMLTTAEAWTRWALPVLFESRVAARGDADLGAVFVRDGDRWRAIAGLDRVIRARAAALDAACAARLDAGSRRCRELGWQIADAALRGDRARFEHACRLAAGPCDAPAARATR